MRLYPAAAGSMLAQVKDAVGPFTKACRLRDPQSAAAEGGSHCLQACVHQSVAPV